MDAWVVWLIAAVAARRWGRSLTTGFFLAPFAVGALVAALVVALVGGGRRGVRWPSSSSSRSLTLRGRAADRARAT